jgi:glutathione S-transferase
MTDRYRLIGANGSPCSMKMRAILRHRLLPFDWVYRSPEVGEALEGKIKVMLVPILHIPAEDWYLIDSTPIAYELERRQSERSILPPDAGLAFLAHLNRGHGG